MVRVLKLLAAPPSLAGPESHSAFPSCPSPYGLLSMLLVELGLKPGTQVQGSQTPG